MPRQEYLKDGKPVVGVTTVLKQRDGEGGLVNAANFAGLNGIKTGGDDGVWTLARDIGTACHALIEGHINRKAVDFSVTHQKAFQGAEIPFGTFLKWSEGKDLSGTTELSLVHPTLPFGGTMDLIKGDTIFDWKSSSDAGFKQIDAIIPQLVAYGMLARAHGYTVRRGVAVQFAKDGAPAKELHVDFDSPEGKLAEDLFCKLLEAYQTRHQLCEIYKAQKKKDAKKKQGSLL